MYKIFLLLVFSMDVKMASAQSAELEQLTLDISKLSQLKGILQDMYTYYAILENGYDNIRDVAKGNFQLHLDYLNSLLTVSPSVSDDPVVQAIAQAQARLLQTYQAVMNQVTSDPNLTTAEIAHIKTACQDALTAGAEDLDELSTVLTNGALRMSDDERLSAVNRIHDDLRTRVVRLQTIGMAAARLSTARKGKAADALNLQNLYGL